MNEDAFDTETVEGYARVVGTTKEAIRVGSLPEIFAFLKKYKNHVLWTWNLTFDAYAIIKYFPFHKAKQLYNSYECEVDGVSVFFIPDKMLKFDFKRTKTGSNDDSVILYDVSPYYGHKSLDSQSKAVLGDSKQDMAMWIKMCRHYQLGRITLAELEAYLDSWSELICLYCQQDCKLTLKLLQYMRKAFKDAGVRFGKPLSAAKIAERYIINYNKTAVKGVLRNRYPRIWDNWKDYHTLARMTYFGGLFESLRRGYFKKRMYDYDIVSAYPSVMQDLPHWGNGRFVEVNEPTYGRYGWYPCVFDCRWIPYRDNEYAEPYKMRYKGVEVELMTFQTRVLYPKGKRVQPVTSKEYWWMKENGYHCEILDNPYPKGIEWVQTQNIYKKPFSYIPIVFKQRQDIIKDAGKTDMRQYALKLLLNSGYGKTAQAEPKLGKLSNFFYASMITAGVRLKCIDAIKKDASHVLEISTDGVILDKELSGLDMSGQLGTWEMKTYDKVLIVGSGMRQLWRDDKFVTKARGFTNDSSYDLKGEMEKNHDKDIICHTKVRPIKLGEIIQCKNVLSYSDLNNFIDVTKELDVNSDKKHNWSRAYKDWDDFLHNPSVGEPLDMKQLL